MAKDSKKNTFADEALGTISAALAILDKMPELQDDNFAISVDIRPVDLIMQCLYKVVGYDEVVKWLSNTIGYALPAIEVAVKSYILTQLKYIFDCTLNPFITYDLIKNGVVFDLKTVDLMNMLQFCPIDKTISNKKKNGKYYYFGCENFNYPDELEQAEDFNALLWYMKNRTIGTRSVWYGYVEQPNVLQHKSLNQKQKKSDGIITLEYSGRSSGLKDAEGNHMTLQTPFNNCIHVFLGNTKPIEPLNSITTAQDAIPINDKQVKLLDIKKKAESLKKRIEDEIKQWKNNKDITKDERNARISEMKTHKKGIDIIIDAIDGNVPLSDVWDDIPEKESPNENGIKTYKCWSGLGNNNDENSVVITQDMFNATNESLTQQKKQVYDDAISQGTHDIYRPIKYNYYYHKTLLEFNTDYIFSLKLFDQKTVTARLLDALSGCISLELDLSFGERLAQNMVRQAVHDMIDSDDVTVSDCFFTFDNDMYNSMMERSESQRIGLMVTPNGVTGQAIDADAIMKSLNNLSTNATNEEVLSAIETSIFEVTRQIVPEYNPGGDPEFNIDWRLNIINNAIQTLAYVIVLTVLSPKLYLLIAVNLKIMGRESTFDMLTFMDNFKQLIYGIVKTVRDELMRLLKEWLMELIGNLAKEVKAKLVLEQMMYYQELLRKCITSCQKIGGQTIGWNQANVDYADIYDTENKEPQNVEC